MEEHFPAMADAPRQWRVQDVLKFLASTLSIYVFFLWWGVRCPASSLALPAALRCGTIWLLR